MTGLRTSRIGASVLVFAALAAIPAGRANDGMPSADDVRARVDAYLAPLVDAGLFSGAVLLARGDRVIVEKAWGAADVAAGVANTPATRFKLMSVSKPLTAVATLSLVQAGRLDLGDPVGKHLQGWPGTWRDVTVRRLLDHTSGLPDLEGEWTAEAMAGSERGLAVWRRLAPRLAGRAPASAPGARHIYHNFNYVLLGLVLEAAGGRPYADVLKREVLDPAGMAQTGLDDGVPRAGLAVGCFRRNGAPVPSTQDMSALLAAGGLCSTVGDLHRLDRALRGDSLLRTETRGVMERPAAAGGSYACGWMVTPVAGRPCVHHSGGANGFVAEYLRFPEDDACVIVLSNFAFAPITRIGADLADILFGRECEFPRRPSEEALDAAAGVYRSPGGAELCFVLRRTGGAVAAYQVFEGYGTCAGEILLPVGAGPLLLPWGRDRLRFVAPEGGRRAALRLEHEGQAMPLDRISVPAASWRSAVGDYRIGPGAAGTARIEEAKGGLKLTLPGMADGLDLEPLSDAAALAVDPSDWGTLLHLERDPGGRVVRFRWTRRPGVIVEGVRGGR